jgi:hemolysin III
MEVVRQAKDLTHDVYGLAKPKLRGAVHAWAIAPFAIAGLVLTLLAPTAQAQISVAIYSFAITGMLAASASYHRLKVSEGARKWLRRLDHSMIGVAVAGTYTPVVMLVSTGTLRWSLLAILWTGAVGGLALTLAWPSGPRWIRAGLYIVLGWAGVAIVPWIWDRAGIAAFLLVAAGGIFYSVGAVIYARRKPNLSLKWFGFHELFHSFVVAAVACHFAAISVVVARVA